MDKTKDTTNTPKERIYQSFLLRCWMEDSNGCEHQPAWRFLLVQSGRRQIRQSFTSLEELVDYLRNQLE